MRSCFLSDHSGLHLRAFQYHQLLKNHIPTLSKHLDTMQIEPTYFYRWILSIFAVTCPLPMLLRIYDLVFAEGVLQVIMRVAISLMRKNEARIVTYKDPEHISQLLNSRGLWDVYHYNADEFVTEITSLSDIVTNHTLQSLEASYRELPDSERFVSIEKLGSSPAGFFGKSWSRPNTSSKLSGGGSEQSSSEQSSEFRRTSSKNSFASTFNSNEGVGSNSMMSSETDLTSVSIDSVNPQRTQLSYQSNKTNHIREDLGRNLHNQIEALLTALNGLQKENAMLVKQLSAQREERNSDRDIILNLLENLRNNMTMQKHSSNQSDDMGQKSASIENGYENNVSLNNKVQYHLTVDSEDQLLPLLDAVESHFLPSLSPRVTLLPTRLQLEDEIARVKEQLKSEISKTQDLDKQLIGQNQEIKTLREQVKQVQLHIRNKHDENQRLERVIRELRSERDTRWRTNNIERGDPSSPIDHGATGSANIGLRRLRLIHERERQSKPTLSQNNNNLLEPSLTRYEKKDQALSPMASPSGADAKNTGQDEEYENLLEKYVLAKTAEAMSREEAEELRDKVESLKKLIDQISKDTPLSVLPKSRTSNSNNSPTGLTGSSTGLNKNDIRSSISSISAVISGAMNPSSKDTPILAATVSNDATSNNSSFGFVSNYFTGSQSETKSLSASAPTDKAGLTVTETSGASIAKSGEINSNGAFAFASNYFNGPKVGTKILPAALTPSTNFEKVVKNTPISIQGKNAPTGFWSGWGKKVQISG